MGVGNLTDFSIDLPKINWKVQNIIENWIDKYHKILRCAADPDLLVACLVFGSRHANTTILEIIKPFIGKLPVQLLDEMMKEAVLSDSQEAVTIVKDLLTDQHHTVGSDVIRTARARGLVKIIKLLDPEYQDTAEQQKQSLKQAVSDKTASIQGEIIFI